MLKLRKLKSDSTSEITLKTKFGDFCIRDIDIDLNIASPSFERLDLDELIKRIQASLHANHDVAFIDVGAGFGNQTVAIANQFKDYQDKLSIYSFEPEPDSYRLLVKNILLNKLTNVHSFEVALSDKESNQQFFYFEPMKQIVSFPTPKKIHIRTMTLDHYMRHIKKSPNTDIYMKFDIEGHELNALIGSQKIINRYKDITLLIEDSASSESSGLTEYLHRKGKFISKKTVYNSFWRLN